jgi:SAM-dependent methyltransferase
MLGSPTPLKPYARSLRFFVKSARALFGNYPRECTVCGHRGRFFAYGYPLVADVLCPKCLSLERHRLLGLYEREHQVFEGKDILHFAPEPGLRRFISARHPKSYTSCDLFATDVDLKIDVEKIALPDAAYDVVLCLHVLEHVDDGKAIPELFRILRPGGLLIAMFPMVEGWDATYEDASVTRPEDRLLHFGQHNHVRFFGKDARRRLAAPGFDVSEFTAVEPFVRRYGLMRGEKIFLCNKPDS